MSKRRRVCFVTGTRAEFGLMESTLRAIQSHRALRLQIIATGMHLDRSRGSSLEQLKSSGWAPDYIVPWRGNTTTLASATGRAMAGISDALESMKTDIVLVVGDRVEAFAGASAAHLSGRVVAHVHGGDRALGQIDDSLRHAITKLAHVHFAVTDDGARRLKKMGEDAWRIHRVGAPGIDGIASTAEAIPAPLRRRRYALLVLHPTNSSTSLEYGRAKDVLEATKLAQFDQIVIVAPNNDPGADGILRCWIESDGRSNVILHRNLLRNAYLGLLRDAAVLIGNSSSGIIEAATFGTPVLDIGPRQLGRFRGENVMNVPYGKAKVSKALSRIWNAGSPVRFPRHNIYGGVGTADRIASLLSKIPLDDRLRRKLIAY